MSNNGWEVNRELGENQSVDYKTGGIGKASTSERWIEGDIPNEAQLALATEYVKATRSKDMNQLKALYYPQSLSCRINIEGVIDRLLETRVKEDIPDDYQVAVSKYNRSKYDVIAQAVGGALVEYAVAPTNMLTIGYRTKDAKGIITGHFLYNRILTANNKWYFILECPGPGYKEFKRRMDKQGAKE